MRKKRRRRGAAMEVAEYLRMVFLVGSIGIVATRAGRLEGEGEEEEEEEGGLVRGSREEGRGEGAVAAAAGGGAAAAVHPKRSYLAWLSNVM